MIRLELSRNNISIDNNSAKGKTEYNYFAKGDHAMVIKSDYSPLESAAKTKGRP